MIAMTRALLAKLVFLISCSCYQNFIISTLKWVSNRFLSLQEKKLDQVSIYVILIKRILRSLLPGDNLLAPKAGKLQDYLLHFCKRLIKCNMGINETSN